MKISNEERQILSHTLGATDRYMKKDWGFRNRFLAGKGSKDYELCDSLVDKGFMVKKLGWRDDESYFCATRKGAVEVGFKAYQLKGKTFPQV